jgi:hypothetical protein
VNSFRTDGQAVSGIPLKELHQPLSLQTSFQKTPASRSIASQTLTLHITPVVHIYLDRLQTWLFGESHPAASASVQPTAAK